jgi:hypothetical protein
MVALAAAALILSAQGLATRPGDGVAFDCDAFEVFAPTDKANGGYRTTAGAVEPGTMLEVRDNLPFDLQLSWRDRRQGFVRLIILDYRSETARYVLHAGDSQTASRTGTCRTRRTGWPPHFFNSGAIAAVELRVDCEVRYRREHLVTRAGQPDGSARYMFMFAPDLGDRTRLGRLYYLASQDGPNGWTVLEQGWVSAVEGRAWPAFGATVDAGRSHIVLASDPQREGRVALRLIHPLNHTMDILLADGDCRIVPIHAAAQAPAR